MKNLKVFSKNVLTTKRKYKLTKGLGFFHEAFTYIIFPIGIGALIYNESSNDIILAFQTMAMLVGFRWAYHLERVLKHRTTPFKDYQQKLIRKLKKNT